MQIFLININEFSEENYNLCLSFMDKKRKDYVSSLKNQKGRLLTVAAEWLTKHNAAKILKKDFDEIVILREEKGKPYIKGNPIFISVSHSGDYAAVGFHTSPIGLDIEVLKPIDKRIKNRICTTEDLKYISQCQNETEENLKLLEIWTAKEAYFKKIGTGITNFKNISYKDITATHNFENSLIITTVI